MIAAALMDVQHDNVVTVHHMCSIWWFAHLCVPDWSQKQCTAQLKAVAGRISSTAADVNPKICDQQDLRFE